ncbi:hypothetical protein N0V93_001285 [Gnomoniopsis smithogilvyi]|uniref:Heterokaryon incompatibility domain-containing protein n=1 Tax=Gnomoniopsis smithogilvyi TaxID=1191159 RepID=A0A9W8Z1B9_9PEZI|nr:hypothetical protein N0V93_001285 [Gnomoniopsis smithogilvyi]
MDVFARLMAEEGLYVAKPTRIFLTLENSDQTHGLGFVCIGTPLYSTTAPQGLNLRAQYLGRLLLHDDSGDSPQPIRPRGSEQEVLDRLATWLRQRESEVPRSSSNYDEPSLPTRVLDLGALDNSDPARLESNLRLLETSGQHGRYVTLSYSWGGYKDCRTLTNNYEDRKLGIPFKSLPPVFQQAIKVTRGLGIRYLWIDALCIIQEDAEDWSREATRMSDVYWLSAVRLAVTSSRNPTEPFFPPREHISVKMPHLRLQGPSLDLGFHSPLPAHLLPKTEEEKVMLLQRQAEFFSMLRQNWRTHVGGEDDDLALGMPWARRRIVEEPENMRRGRGAPRMTRREGNILRKLPQTSVVDSKEARGSPNNDRGIPQDAGMDENNEFESVGAQDQQHDPLDGVAGSLPHPSLNNNDDIRLFTTTSDIVKATQDLALDMMNRWYNKRPSKEKSDAPTNIYLSMPRFYARDVDRGHLNSRGWVLQERLLAPRTIHFTKHHIYCEDNDDICGEDWVRRYFTWMSCIRKESSHAQVNLFPERSSVLSGQFTSPQDDDFGPQVLRGMYWKPESQYIRRPWHNISESFSKCQLSFDTDRLAAIAGLVHRKCMDPKSVHVNGRNLCGLWEKTLYVDLAWFCENPKAGEADPGRIRGLPSWSWMSYKGPICFVRDARSTMDAGTPLTRTAGMLELVNAQVPEPAALLPLATPASLTLRVAMRRVYGVSTRITKYGMTSQSRKDLAKVSPFDFDPRTTTVPVSLSSLTDCQEMFNEDRHLVGFVAFDESIHVVGALFCAHISTLTDEALTAAENDLAKPGVETVDMRDYQRPILAYALVLSKVKAEENTYKRVGLAEMSYYWMTSAEKEVVTIL